ncbi:MAG: alpha/beta hydrolase [Anaerolineae bacterium]|nr:alpha/beta hydrolase [Anaerolineae bacterium]
MSNGFAPAGNARLYYEIAGEGSPLVLIHAGICDSRMWDDQVPALAAHYRVIRYDLRGFGQSQPVAGSFTHYEDLRALLDHLDVERAVLLGCSLGGMTALDFALTYPQRVRGLILVGSGLAGFESQQEEDPPEWIEAQKAFESGDYERASEMEVRVWVDGPQRAPDQVPAAVRDKVRQMNTIALKNEAAGLGEVQKLEPPAAHRLGKIQAPALVVVGDLDQPEMIEIAHKLAAEIPNADPAIILTGTAHVPNMEQPAKFNRHVLDWLGRQAAAAE